MQEDQLTKALEVASNKMQLHSAILLFDEKLVAIGKPKKKKEVPLGPDGLPLLAADVDKPKGYRGLTTEIRERIEANAAEKKINQGAFITKLVQEHDALSPEVKISLELGAASANVSQAEFIAQLVAEHEAAKLARVTKETAKIVKEPEPVAAEIPSPTVSLWSWILRIFGFRK